MIEKKASEYQTGADEVYDRGKIGLQFVALLSTSSKDEDFTTAANHREIGGKAVTKVRERWIDRNYRKDAESYNNEALRYAILVRDGRVVGGGAGENFGLVYARMFRHFVNGDLSHVRRVVASFDGELQEKYEKMIKAGLKGIKIRAIGLPKRGSHSSEPPESDDEKRLGISLVIGADIAAKTLGSRAREGRLGELIRDERLAGVWVGEEEISLEELRHKINGKDVGQEIFESYKKNKIIG
ncbi:MAG: hypothetical protein AABW73_01815 [Nanoarchaeota archaeon]